MKTMGHSLKDASILIIILLSILFYVYYGLYKMLFVNIETLGFDFKVYYNTAKQYLNGISIYHDNIYIYPPLSLLVFLPFSMLEKTIAVVTWFLICNVLFIISAFLIYSWGKKGKKYQSAVATIIAFLFSMPLYSTIFLGNLNILIFFGICLIYHFVMMRNINILPWIIMVTAYQKIFPTILLAIFLRRSCYRSGRLIVLALLVVTTISIWIFGYKEHIMFILNMPEAYKWVGKLQMYSISYFIKLYIPIDHSITIVITIVYGCLLFTLWWNRGKEIKNFNMSALLVDLSLLSVIMLLLFPSSSINYGIFLIIPFYFIILAWLQNQKQFRHFWLFIILFLFINLWEIISNHIPLTSEKFSIVELQSRQAQYPILYLLVYSLPFMFMTLFYWWLLLNYKKLDQAIRKLICEASIDKV